MKYAWTWNIKPECLDEYLEMHAHPGPEIMKAHHDAGFRNYSIFQNGCQFIYVFESDDAQASFDYVNNNEDCKRWNAITTKMIDTDCDGAIDSGIQYLHEAFYLE